MSPESQTLVRFLPLPGRPLTVLTRRLRLSGKAPSSGKLVHSPTSAHRDFFHPESSQMPSRLGGPRQGLPHLCASPAPGMQSVLKNCPFLKLNGEPRILKKSVPLAPLPMVMGIPTTANLREPSSFQRGTPMTRDSGIGCSLL